MIAFYQLSEMGKRNYLADCLFRTSHSIPAETPPTTAPVKTAPIIPKKLFATKTEATTITDTTWAPGSFFFSMR